jgi:hypothetical protein
LIGFEVTAGDAHIRRGDISHPDAHHMFGFRRPLICINARVPIRV